MRTENQIEVSNLKGDIARSEFIQIFKEVQRLKTQLEQYTELRKKMLFESKNCYRKIPCVRFEVHISIPRKG